MNIARNNRDENSSSNAVCVLKIKIHEVMREIEWGNSIKKNKSNLNWTQLGI